MDASGITTDNLRLVAVEPFHVEALSRDKRERAEVLGVAVPDGWPQFPEAFAPPEDGGSSRSERPPTGWRDYFFVPPRGRAPGGPGAGGRSHPRRAADPADRSGPRPIGATTSSSTREGARWSATAASRAIPTTRASWRSATSPPPNTGHPGSRPGRRRAERARRLGRRGDRLRARPRPPDPRVRDRGGTGHDRLRFRPRGREGGGGRGAHLGRDERLQRGAAQGRHVPRSG